MSATKLFLVLCFVSLALSGTPDKGSDLHDDNLIGEDAMEGEDTDIKRSILQPQLLSLQYRKIVQNCRSMQEKCKYFI